MHIFILVISLLLGFITAGLLAGISPVVLISDIFGTVFTPDKNSGAMETISGANFLLPYYLMLLYALLGTAGITLSGKIPAFSRQRLRSHAVIQTVLVLGALLFSQTVSQVRYFAEELSKFSGKSLDEKMAYNFAKSYGFARYCRELLPGRHHCGVISDIDKQPQKNLITYLAVRYYVYPLDIVTPTDPADQDCQIVFLKQDPREAVPPGYAIKPPFDSRSLIAVREGSAP
ncbi:MAG: hypothetical protein KC897_00470 [Candidatus Omnitrophica bacterium]|nr:hypothetical protein [Candidatus Omnitrophota bacterium]MCB9721520.1 hypothetical protein [Candidatus Omnitrophota bacterium]